MVFRGEGAIEVSAATRCLSTYPEYKYSKQLKENKLIDYLRDCGFFRLVDVPELSEEVLSMMLTQIMENGNPAVNQMFDKVLHENNNDARGNPKVKKRADKVITLTNSNNINPSGMIYRFHLHQCSWKRKRVQ